jgi:hypothetical protein
MRRSASVVAPLLAATAVVLLSGCKQTEMERCVDEQNHVVDQSFCKNLPQNSTQTLTGTPTTTGGVYVPHYYRHYYGGAGGYALGSIVSGGSYAPTSGHSYSTTAGHSSTSRGGFGSSFSSSSS